MRGETHSRWALSAARRWFEFAPGGGPNSNPSALTDALAGRPGTRVEPNAQSSHPGAPPAWWVKDVVTRASVPPSLQPPSTSTCVGRASGTVTNQSDGAASAEASASYDVVTSDESRVE